MLLKRKYLEELKRWKDIDLIKVVTGIRRCGKSTLFDLFVRDLKENNIKEDQIIQINLEDVEYDLENYKELYDFVNKKITSQKKYYVFLDEVQKSERISKSS